MKTYKKVGKKIYSTESVEVEVDISSIKNRIETLDQAIVNLKKQFDKLGIQNNTYEIEKTGLEAELKKVKKL